MVSATFSETLVFSMLFGAYGPIFGFLNVYCGVWETDRQTDRQTDSITKMFKNKGERNTPLPIYIYIIIKI